MPGKKITIYDRQYSSNRTKSQNQVRSPRIQTNRISSASNIQEKKMVKKPITGKKSTTPAAGKKDAKDKIETKDRNNNEIGAIHPNDKKTNNKPESDVKSSQKNSRNVSPRSKVAYNVNYKKEIASSNKTNLKSSPQKAAQSSLQKVAQSNPQKPAQSSPQAQSSLQKVAQSNPQKPAQSSPQKAAQSSTKKTAHSSSPSRVVRSSISKISPPPSPKPQINKKHRQNQQNQEQIHEQDIAKESKEEPINVQNKNEVHFEQPQQIPVIANNTSNIENDLREKRINELISVMDNGFNNISKILNDDIFKEIDIPSNLVCVEDV